MNASLMRSLPRPAARTFQDLVVWRKAHELVLAIYTLTATFPQAGNLRVVPADAAGGHLDPGQHCGRVRRRGKADKAATSTWRKVHSRRVGIICC